MVNLALLLEDRAGGVEQDGVGAVSLYERAISDGSHVGAMINLALLEDGAIFKNSKIATS